MRNIMLLKIKLVCIKILYKLFFKCHLYFNKQIKAHFVCCGRRTLYFLHIYFL